MKTKFQNLSDDFEICNPFPFKFDWRRISRSIDQPVSKTLMDAQLKSSPECIKEHSK